MKSCLSFDFLTPTLDQQHTARVWIQSVLQVQLPDAEDLYTSLRDGIFLCKLMNSLIPNSMPVVRYEHSIEAWVGQQTLELKRAAASDTGWNL
ncbi:hypothetical protein BJV82DRAFT_144900 [Fennellomyces sp. T-0311]|nr:hypothetical protein BJV82DRAFT_144900 [Fennellomyces sp. T-0311]